MKKILILCRGNVARSQMAEAFFHKLSPHPLNIISAGTLVPRPGEVLTSLLPRIAELITAMQEEGIDLSQKSRTQVTPEMVRAADQIILVIDDRDPVPDYVMDHQRVLRWDVLDPKGQSLEFTREVRDRIKGYVEEYIKDKNTETPD